MNLKKRILVSAGDPSGDLILSKIIENLRELYPHVEFNFLGLCGPNSESMGVKVLASSKDVAVVGIWEVLRNLKKIFGVLGVLGAQLNSVDSVLCVDFPDFNFKLSEWAYKQKVPVDYVVAPQVWAWRGNRLVQMKRWLRKLYPALPFEESLLRQAGISAQYLGHPLRDLLQAKDRRGARKNFSLETEDFVICLMPGSRTSELKRHLPLLLSAWEEFKEGLHGERYPGLEPRLGRMKVLLPLASGWTPEGLQSLLSPQDLIKWKSLFLSGEWVCVNSSHQALMASDFGWIVSGTASLEAAYYQIPHILLYRLSWFSARLIKALTNYFDDTEGYAALPNIILEKRVIPEILQDFLNPRRLAIETLELLRDNNRLSEMKRDLRWLPRKMGEAGVSRRIAQDLGKLWNLEA